MVVGETLDELSPFHTLEVSVVGQLSEGEVGGALNQGGRDEVLRTVGVLPDVDRPKPAQSYTS